jgi:hypothetical protein
LNQTVYRQGEEASNVYIIFRGDFELVRANKIIPTGKIEIDETVVKVKGKLVPKNGKERQLGNPRGGQR